MLVHRSYFSDTSKLSILSSTMNWEKLLAYDVPQHLVWLKESIRWTTLYNKYFSMCTLINPRSAIPLIALYSDYLLCFL